MINPEMYSLLVNKSIKELKEIQDQVEDIINAKMRDEEMFELLQKFSELKVEPTLENKVNFLLKEGRKLKAILLVKETKMIGLREAKEFVDWFQIFEWDEKEASE